MKHRLRMLTGLGVVIAGLAATWAGLAQSASPVQIFNSLVPKDGNVTVVRDLAYGDDPRQRLDIYRPANGGNAVLPVVYFAYGGGWESGEKGDYGFVGHALASRGYVTVIADYRLVPEIVFPDFVLDTGSAVNWVLDHISEHGGDPERLALMGHSAGAYNVMMVALSSDYGVDPARISAVIGLSGPYDFYPFDVSQSQNAFGAFARPEDTQPVNLVSNAAPPVLLVHGDGDQTVAPRNSVALAEQLTEAVTEVSLAIYSGANHADTLISIAMPLRWRYPVLEDVTSFLGTELAVSR